jgi:hypothetical protein
MSRLLAALTVLVLLASPAAASAIRIDLTKANQAKAAMKFSLTTSSAHGLVTVRLELPRKQPPLDHLWRIDVVMRKGNKTLLTAPLETKLDGGVLSTTLLLDPASMTGVEIWIRTGEHAPLAETIYVVDVGSFK